MKRVLCYILSLCLVSSVYAQNDSIQKIEDDSLNERPTDTLRTNFPTAGANQRIYVLKPSADIPVFVIGAGWSGYALSKIYRKPPIPDEVVLSLDKNRINGFDRWAVRPYSKSLDRISYYPFFGSMPLPFLFLFGNTRKDFFKLGFLYLEAMSVTGFLYTGSVYLADRYRPYAYSDQSTMQQRTRGGAKNSFYAGHVALVATSTFFMAKVYADYHPDSKAKWVFYSLAGAATGVTAYLRYRAGQHFPTDILLGTAQGTLTGLLVPQFHKHKLIKDPNLSIVPFGNGQSLGFSCVYKIN